MLGRGVIDGSVTLRSIEAQHRGHFRRFFAYFCTIVRRDR
jgi:hypothetical protein